MSDHKKQLSLMAILTVCAVFAALVSFFLPLFSINFLGTHSYSGCDAIIDAFANPDYPELGIAVCLVFTIISIICSLMALKDNSFCGGTIVTSAIGMILMVVALSDDSDLLKPIDYAAAGFYVYEIMSLAAVVLSAASIYLSKNAVPAGDGTLRPVPELTHKLTPVPLAKVICPACKREQAHDAAYCRFCGTKILRTASTRVSNPLPGDAVDWFSIPKKPAAVEKPARKAICPYCGARQSEDTIRCKYCGTSMK